MKRKNVFLKLISFFVVLVCAICLLASCDSPETEETEDTTPKYTEGLVYKVADGKTAGDIVSGYGYSVRAGSDKSIEELIIPEYYNGVAVLMIEKEGFTYMPNLKKVVIPDTVQRIGKLAFSACPKLTTIEIGKDVTYIGDFALNSSTITEIIVDEENKYFKTIDGSLYSKDGETLVKYVPKNGEKTFVVPEGVKKIGKNAFNNAKNLEAVTFSSTVTKIESYAFEFCKSLKTIDFGTGVCSIGQAAFSHCESLEALVMPNQITYVGDGAFSNCKSLKTVELSANLSAINRQTFKSCDKIEVVNIGIKTEKICRDAFDGCDSLILVTIPESVTQAEDNVFGDGSIANLVVYCSAASKPKDWNSSWFKGSKIWGVENYGISSDGFIWYEIADNPGNIEVTGLLGEVTDVIIPDTIDGKVVVSIGADTFNENKSVKSISIGKNVTSIGKIDGCTSLERIIVDKNNTSYTSADGVLFSKDMTVLETYPANRENASFTVPSGVKKIKEGAFDNCQNLEYLILSDSVEEIERYAFECSRALKSITLGKNLSTIGRAAFENCDRLVELYNLSDTEEFEEDGYLTFYVKVTHTSATSPSIIDEVNEYVFAMFDNGVYLLDYIGSDKELILPDDYIGRAYSIYEKAFYYDDSIVSVTIPDSVECIGSYAFEGCSNLVSLDTGNGVTELPFSVFKDCKNLKNVKLSTKLVKIDYAFYGCESLESVVLPNGLKEIARGSFSTCKSLNNVIIPDSVTLIGDRAFSNCTSLENITIGNGVETIEELAFFGSELKSVVIPASVKVIEKYAFDACDSLKNIYCEAASLPANWDMYWKDGGAEVTWGYSK